MIDLMPHRVGLNPDLAYVARCGTGRSGTARLLLRRGDHVPVVLRGRSSAGVVPTDRAGEDDRRRVSDRATRPQIMDAEPALAMCSRTRDAREPGSGGRAVDDDEVRRAAVDRLNELERCEETDRRGHPRDGGDGERYVIDVPHHLADTAKGLREAYLSGRRTSG